MKLHELPASATALGFARIAIFATWMIVLVRANLPVVAELPFDWFRPWGPLILLPDAAIESLLQPAPLWTIHVLACALALGLLLGVRPFEPLACVFVGVVILAECLAKGFCGYANHAQFALLYATMVMTLFPCANGCSILGPTRRAASDALLRAPMLLVPIVVGLTYAAIGLRRITSGGLEIFLDDTILTYLTARSLEYSAYGFEHGLLVHSSPLLIAKVKIGYVVTTFAEIAAPAIILVGWRLRLVWLAIILPFHLLSLLTMNIFFWENVILLIVFFTGLPHWIARRRDPVERGSAILPA